MPGCGAAGALEPPGEGIEGAGDWETAAVWGAEVGFG